MSFRNWVMSVYQENIDDLDTSTHREYMLEYQTYKQQRFAS